MIHPVLIEMDAMPAIEAEDTLSRTEMDIYRNMVNEGRRREFLYGRYAIKKSLLEHFIGEQKAFDQITVDYGVLRYPILRDHVVEVGLSHSKQYILAVLYTKDQLVGVDVETIRDGIPVDDMLSEAEQALIAQAGFREAFGYMFFSCKEALGKALRMGLLADYPVYEISGIARDGRFQRSVYRLKFAWFPFLTGYCFMKNEMEICSIVVPAKMDIEAALAALMAS
ncbi:4'-phosphopantetheinyl transferase superfamily protein [Paenibacillus spiritus]|uniref:4'-phosphopantetheinyl transferase superfamily protein n=1 Tax=Paenibacillus spiritus TaxID=2496557 RepID=A0A5J5FXY6_9BACL|nr:4'-phosphopantetheinyl transferase superfamily protein [Paenibacillus spiritus]KAA8998809.1 4'-phosphopantetheinyl transferase superfamily protein [Paenibacillus spiritus]